MIKKIDIMGIELDNYTVREAIMIVEQMLSNNVFNTLQEVDMSTLLLAGENEIVKNVLENLDHTVISEVGILDAAGEKTIQREHEIADHDFFLELFKRVERNHKTVFLIGEKEAEVSELFEFLCEEFPRIEIVGANAVESCVGASEAIANQINSENVDVILSILPSPMQEQFLYENRDRLSANLWYGIGDNKFVSRKNRFSDSIANLIKVRKLARHINDYEEKRESE